jgi:hypothetical protein
MEVDEMENKEYLFSFEKLVVWHDAREFITGIYNLTDNFPFKEKFGLSSQIQRAAVSVAANIAEGSSRFSKKRFYKIYSNILWKFNGSVKPCLRCV